MENNTGNKCKYYTNTQLTFLVILRFLIGWHLMYEGIAKLMNPDWSSLGFLLDSGGLLSGIFIRMTYNPGVLAVVDFLNIWGLIAIGLGLVIGLFTRFATITGIVLISFYYLSHPPFPGLQFSLPNEGNYLIVNKNLVELSALAVLYVFPTGNIIGLDRFFRRSRNQANQ